MTYDVSVYMPSIRTHLLEDWFASLEKSCNRHSFEAVICGPFEPPKSLTDRNNFQWIKSFASPTVCAQLAAINSNGKLLYHVVDDVFFLPGILSDLIDFYTQESYTRNDLICSAKYFESDIEYKRFKETGEVDLSNKHPDNYWLAGGPYGGWPQINPNWNIGVHHLITKDLFIEFGGYDCEFEYLNYGGHDFLLRLQSEGIEYIDYPETISVADWLEGRQGDRKEIHDSYAADLQIFAKKWYYNNRGNKYLNINNWKNQPEVWNRRFKNSDIKSYAEMGYDENN